MHKRRQFPNMIFGASLRPEGATLAVMLMLLFLTSALLLVTLTAQPAEAQTFTVIYNFTGGLDGAFPEAGLTLDKTGSLYGTAAGGGGSAGNGTVFRLTQKGSGWILNPLYNFQGGSDGYFPIGRVIFGPDGSLYGPTWLGGVEGCDNGQGCGTVFNLKPQPTACKTAICPWTETVLYRFTQRSDGGNPMGEVVFDKAGNLYGTAYNGGGGNGVVYELTASYPSWTETAIYSFAGGSDGEGPQAPVIFDTAGNLYGTTIFGGVGNNGTVFQLTPSASGWTEKVLYRFQNGSDGHRPLGRLVFDHPGNLYGTTEDGGAGNGGTVFELTPSDGSWTYNLVYSFAGSGGSDDLVMDAAGNLYGTTYSDGAYGWGSAFKLTASNGGWSYTSLHDFTGGSDGGNPIGGLAFDANGNLYGTTFLGGVYNDGVVFKITP
jgi:uncharacterized repeat protein (TIGR03803 family)